MIMERVQSLTRLITQFPDKILIMAYPSWVPVVCTIGDSFPLGVDHAVGTSSTPELARLPTSPMVSREEKHQMPGSHLKFVRTLDFGVLNGLGMRAAAEIRDAEDALIAFSEQQARRDALHVKTKEEIAAKYNQQDRLGGAA